MTRGGSIYGLFLGVVLSILVGVGTAFGGWTATLEAEGEDLGGVNTCSVTLGVSEESELLPYPPDPPDYSVKMLIYSLPDWQQAWSDVREEGEELYRWLIGINPHGSIMPPTPRSATVSWNPEEFDPSGDYRLLAGYDASASVVVSDMRTTTSYTVTGDDSVQIFTVEFSVGSATENYTVTFKDHDGTVLKTEQVQDGGAATAPAHPVREGYTFTGWDAVFDDIIENLTVTAQYEIDQYTLTYTAGANGSIGGEAIQEVAYGSDGTPVDPVPDRGYRFARWSDGSAENPRMDTNVRGDLSVTANFHMLGDVNDDEKIDLSDAILALQVVSGGSPAAVVHRDADVDGDGRVGLNEAVFVLQVIGEIE